MIKKLGRKMKIITIVSIAVIFILMAMLIGCYQGDPFPEGWFEKVFVGDPSDRYVLTSQYGSVTASGSIRSEVLITSTAYDGGAGLWVFDYGYADPYHTGVGDFDLTGGLYENRFYSTTPVFTIADSDDRNFIIIISGDNYGKCAEIITYIDVNSVVVNPWNWTADLTDVEFAIVPHPLLASGAGGHTSIHAFDEGNVEVDSRDYINGALYTVTLDSGADAVAGILVVVDANGYASIEAIEAEYNTGDLQPGDLVSIIKLNMDETDAAASDATTEVDFISMLTTDENDLLKHAIHVGQSFDSAFTVSGGIEEDPDHGYSVVPDLPTDRVTGIAPDGTAFLEASASDVIIFNADNDYILIGSDATFEAMDAILVSGANQPILPEFYYSTGAGTWSALVVEETTNGFTQSGTIAFEAPAGWALSNLTQPAGAAINNAFYVKVVRTRNNLGLPPVEDYFKTYTTSSLTDFEIRGDGTIRPVEMADAAAPNNSLYFSTTQNKLVYKDNGGVVHDLW